MNKLSGNPKIMKEVNSGLIKQVLKEKTTATRAEIVKYTGISTTTVRTLIEELIIDKEIVSVGYDDSSGGRRAERYALNLRNRFSLSFYMDDRNINYATYNQLGDIVEKKSIKAEGKSIYEFIEDMFKVYKIKAIGIGVSGVVDKGNFFSGRNLNNWSKSNVGEYLSQKYNIPVILENDLNAIALGFSMNYIKEMKEVDINSLNLAYINFTKIGVGAGIIANGKLVRGENNFAGELGFIPIGTEGHLIKVLNNNPDDKSYVRIIAQVIATVNCIINPAFIVVGGDSLRRNLIEDIKEECKTYVPNNVIPKIIMSEDSGDDYLDGIAYLTNEAMNSGIKLIKNEIK
ncbi:ROK family protein [Clostridium sp. YIM B02551]|uniref:ROK family protein n=1 Tax=Clostridium sp. YIM B02551 TaxID=2910679 RepID=UPI001EEBE234